MWWFNEPDENKSWTLYSGQPQDSRERDCPQEGLTFAECHLYWTKSLLANFSMLKWKVTCWKWLHTISTKMPHSISKTNDTANWKYTQRVLWPLNSQALLMWNRGLNKARQRAAAGKRLNSGDLPSLSGSKVKGGHCWYVYSRTSSWEAGHTEREVRVRMREREREKERDRRKAIYENFPCA